MRKWLTRKQLLEYFDSEVVKAIIHRKVSDSDLCQTEVRGHPECSSLKQYLTLVEDEEEQVEESKITDMFKLRETQKADEDDEDESSEEAEQDLYDCKTCHFHILHIIIHISTYTFCGVSIIH